MQDYKERIANAWKASDKPPKEWISNHTLNIVREARIRLKARGKDDYTLYELSRECNMSSSIVTACMWSLTKGKTILPGTRPLQDTVHEVYDVICLYQKEYETSPTVREITPVSSSAPPAALPAKNTEHRKMSSGNRPLHGAKLLVRMAMSRSRGESMMRQPVTPQALHPKPMHMVRLCLPLAPAHWKAWSS